MSGRKPIAVTDEFLASQGHTRESYNKLSKGGRWSVRNRKKHRAAAADWAARNPEKKKRITRDYFLRRDYGITHDDYLRMLEEQGGKCAGCGTDTPSPVGDWEYFAVDHCHHTGKVRGLLCNPCNRGMGLLRDDPDILRALLNYLKEHTND